MFSIAPLLLVSFGVANTYLFPLFAVYAVFVVLIAGFLTLVTRDLRRLLAAAEKSNACLSARFDKLQRESSAKGLRLAMERSNNTLLGVLFDALVTDDFANVRLLELGLDVHRAEKARHEQEVGLESVDPSDEAFQKMEAYWQRLCEETQKRRRLLETLFALLHGTRGDRLRYTSAEEYVRVHDPVESDATSVTPTPESIVDYVGDPNPRRLPRAVSALPTEQEVVEMFDGVSAVAGEASGPKPPRPRIQSVWWADCGIDSRSNPRPRVPGTQLPERTAVPDAPESHPAIVSS